MQASICGQRRVIQPANEQPTQMRAAIGTAKPSQNRIWSRASAYDDGLAKPVDTRSTFAGGA